jgi:hypothetical protein
VHWLDSSFWEQRSEQQSSISRVHQAYGRNYQLPNATAHNETCAAIGNVLWNHRMWKASAQVKYIDALEHSLFNAVLSGVSLHGTWLSYTNTLRQLEEMPAPLAQAASGVDQPLLLPAKCCQTSGGSRKVGLRSRTATVEPSDLWFVKAGDRNTRGWSPGDRPDQRLPPFLDGSY